MRLEHFNYEAVNIQEIFRELRKARGYTQADISDDILSRSLISKFENGTSMLSADKLFHAIANLNMTPNEFYNILNTYNPTRMEKLYSTLNQIRFSGLQGVKKAEGFIIEGTEDKFQILSNIMIKSVLQDITGNQYVSKEEEYIVEKYLGGIEDWTEFEVKLLYYVSPILDDDNRRWFGEILLEKTKKIYDGSYKRLCMMALMSLYDSVLDNQNLSDAQFFRNQISKFNFYGDLVAIINFQVLNDFHDYISERTKKNLIKAEKYLDKVEELGVEEIVKYSRNRLRDLKSPPPDVSQIKHGQSPLYQYKLIIYQVLYSL